MSSIAISEESGIYHVVKRVKTAVLGEHQLALMGDSAEKECCYVVNDSDNVGDCGSEQKSDSLPLFKPNCSIDSPMWGAAEENGSSNSDTDVTIEECNSIDIWSNSGSQN